MLQNARYCPEGMIPPRWASVELEAHAGTLTLILPKQNSETQKTTLRNKSVPRLDLSGTQAAHSEKPKQTKRQVKKLNNRTNKPQPNNNRNTHTQKKQQPTHQPQKKPKPKNPHF